MTRAEETQALYGFGNSTPSAFSRHTQRQQYCYVERLLRISLYFHDYRIGRLQCDLYNQVTGLGSIDVYNFINGWYTAMVWSTC
jgi:hypothetical protein